MFEVKKTITLSELWNRMYGNVDRGSIQAKILEMQFRQRVSDAKNFTVQDWDNFQARMGASKTEINKEPL